MQARGDESEATVLFDAVVFDLDGTLLATDGFWVPAAREGARRAFAELGLERALPTPAEWLSLVGLPLEEGFRQLFADLTEDQRALVMKRCLERERFALAAGEAALLPGARELLEHLAAGGVRLGLASNCGRDYLENAMTRVGLSHWINQARCLDSPDCPDKAAMVGEISWSFGTRSLVVVGDRAGDGDAARANGFPFVFVRSGFAPSGEEAGADAVCGDLREVGTVLGARAEALDQVLDELGLRPCGGPRIVGIGGPPGSGRTLLARDLARRLVARGRRARTVATERFRRPGASDGPGSGPLDLDRLVGALLRLHAAGRRTPLPLGGGAVLQPPLAPDEVLLLEGPGLAEPRVCSRLDRFVWLAAPEELCLARLVARDVPLEGEAAAERARRRLAAERTEAEATGARARADLVLDGARPLAPRPLVPEAGDEAPTVPPRPFGTASP